MCAVLRVYQRTECWIKTLLLGNSCLVDSNVKLSVARIASGGKLRLGSRLIRCVTIYWPSRVLHCNMMGEIQYPSL